MNKMKCYKFICCILTFAVSASICGCSKQDKTEPILPDTMSYGIITSSVDYSEAKKYSFSRSVIELSAIDGATVYDRFAYDCVGDLYYIVSSISNSDSDGTVLAVTKMTSNAVSQGSYYLDIADDERFVPQEIVNLVNESNSYLSNYDDYIESEYNCSIGYSNINVLKDGCIFGVVEYNYSYNSPVNGTSIWTTEKILCKWDNRGNLLWNDKVVDKDVDDYLLINNIFTADDKYLVIFSLNNEDYILDIYDGNGNIIGEKFVPFDSNILRINDVIENNNNLIAFYKDDAGLQKAAYFDIATATLSGDIVLPDYLVLYGYNSVCSKSDTEIVFSNGIGVYSFNINNKELDVVVDYVNSDFDGYYVDSLAFVNDSVFFGVYNDIKNYSQKIAVFKADDSDTAVEEKAILVLGGYNLPISAREEILDFNNNDSVYRVIVKDYAFYDTLEDSNKGCKLLEQEIMAGNGPDLTMMDPGLINTYSLAKSGKLLPWSYFVNADVEFSGTDFMNEVLDAYAIDGLDYIFLYNFRYRTFIGNTDVVGNGTYWTVNQFTNAASKAPSADGVMYAYNTQEDFLNKLILFNAYEFIDYEKQTTSFNSKDFINMLNYAIELPENPVGDTEVYDYIGMSYRNGNILLKEEYVVAVDAFWEDSYRYFDGKASVVGFPGSSEKSSIIEFVDLPIMIMAEENITAAWTFTKRFYSQDYQYHIVNAIPITYTAFDMWGNAALANQNYVGINELGESFTVEKTYYYNGNEYVIPEMTSENINIIKAVILTNSKASCYDITVQKIIEEEAVNFFNGTQTAKQAASNIDSRVMAYLFQ